jgi:hypothetical protein
MKEDTETLAAAMVQIDRFCIKVQSLIADNPPDSEREALRLKLAQSRAMLADLQRFYNEDSLTIETTAVRSEFRFLVFSLLWVAFHARRIIDYKTFRMLVLVEAAFTSVLSDALSEGSPR